MATHYFQKGVFQLPKGHEEDVKHLRDWLKGQPHLPQISDEHLYLFLNSCDYQLTKTKETLENYYTLRTHSTDLFSKRDPSLPEMQVVSNIVNLVPVNWTSPEGYKLMVCRLVDYDASKFNYVDVIKNFFMFADMRFSEEGLLPGYIVVFDMKGFSMSHLTKLSLSTVKKFMTYVQDCQPAALKGVHIINTVSFIDKLMILIKPFINSELLDMLKFHGPVQEMEKYVPLDSFPQEYGGKSESAVAVHAKQQKLMKEFTKWFQQEEILKVDEKKRQGKQHPYSETFGGAEGSFRKLAID